MNGSVCSSCDLGCYRCEGTSGNCQGCNAGYTFIPERKFCQIQCIQGKFANNLNLCQDCPIGCK